MWSSFFDWLQNFKWVKKADREFYRSVVSITGFSPKNLKHYQDALRHKSAWKNASDKNSIYYNERLEFLGDAILSMLVSEYLYTKFPRSNEGLLSETRTRIINRNFLNRVAYSLKIQTVLTHYVQTHKNNKELHSIYGNALEALIGAIYLDRGFGYTEKFFHEKIVAGFPDFEKALRKEVNYKSRLLEWGQKNNRVVVFELMEDTESDSRLFNIRVLIDGEEKGVGKSSRKKKAEQLAAARAFKIIKHED